MVLIVLLSVLGLSRGSILVREDQGESRETKQQELDLLVEYLVKRIQGEMGLPTYSRSMVI